MSICPFVDLYDIYDTVINASEFRRNMDKYVVEKSRKLLEGNVFPQGYCIPDTVKVISIDNDNITHQYSGIDCVAIFPIKYSAKFFNVSVGDIYEATVENINDIATSFRVSNVCDFNVDLTIYAPRQATGINHAYDVKLLKRGEKVNIKIKLTNLSKKPRTIVAIGELTYEPSNIKTSSVEIEEEELIKTENDDDGIIENFDGEIVDIMDEEELSEEDEEDEDILKEEGEEEVKEVDTEEDNDDDSIVANSDDELELPDDGDAENEIENADIEPDEGDADVDAEDDF